jgi:hypothetical protein
MTPLIGVPKFPSASWMPPSGPGATGWLKLSSFAWKRQ